MHVVDIGSYIYLTVFGISGGEVVKVVPIVEPNLKEKLILPTTHGCLKYILYWQVNVTS